MQSVVSAVAGWGIGLGVAVRRGPGPWCGAPTSAEQRRRRGASRAGGSSSWLDAATGRRPRRRSGQLVGRGARRQEVADRPAARHDDRRARQGRDARADARGRPRARSSASSASSSSQQQRGRRVAAPDDAEPARGAVQHEGARPVGRAHGRGRAAPRRLRSRASTTASSGARRAAGHPRLHVPAARTTCCCTWT